MDLGRWLPRLLPIGAGAAALGLLLASAVPDLRLQPVFEDEAVAGLIGARPLPELLGTVLADRGGAPLHFVLAHVTLALDPSPEALRWLSLVFAVATIPLAADLGRRLGGTVAAAGAAIVVGTSTMLGIYASFGRMYSLFAFAGALAADLFVRAVHERTTRAAIAAAAAAWLLPAIHPYGLIPLVAGAIVALVLWRGRPLAPGLAVGGVMVLAAPFVWADARLASRFTVGVGGDASLAGPLDAWSQLARALASFAGGWVALTALCLALGGLGLVVLVRREPAFAAFALLSMLAAPMLFMLLGSGNEAGLAGLSPRHLVFALPVWAVLVGTGVAQLLARARIANVAAALIAGAVLVAVAPGAGVEDPREVATNTTLGGGARPAGAEDVLRDPARWLRETAGERDLLFPISPVYFAALPEAGRATSLPRGQATLLLAALERARFPARALFVAIPVPSSAVDATELGDTLGPTENIRAFDRWLIVRAAGPLSGPGVALSRTYEILRATGSALRGSASRQVTAYVTFAYSVVCDALVELERRCVTPG
jgi:hypothetical protein